MKRLFFTLLLFATMAGYAYDFQSGDFYYNVTSSSAPYTAEVTYQHYQSISNYSGLTTSNIPKNVTYNGITYSVTSIGEDAFRGCSSLTSVTIPNSVTSIGNSAFEYCSSLTSMFVEEGNTIYDSRDNSNAIIETATNTLITGCSNTTIPNSVTSIGDYAFSGCSSLTSITIPNSVTSIGSGAFHKCSSLTSITIPESVTSIGHRAFYYCTSLTSVTIPNSVTSIGSSVFYKCSSLTSVTIPNSVTSIGDEAFYYCTSLTSITIPESVTSIGEEAFQSCRSLTSITIPNSVTSIGFRAFYGCTSLTSITIPNSVTSIATDAFAYCSSLTSITIPNSVTRIGSSAFRDCSSLTSITIPNSVTSIGDGAFYNCSSLTSVTIPNSVTSIRDDAFYNCSSLTSITIPNSVTSIGSSAFNGCSSLTSITIPNSVTSIGNGAFDRCSSLTSVTIGSGVTSIGVSAFEMCTSLTSIVIPNSVTSIGWNAFRDCSSLTSVTIGNSVESIRDNAFYGCRSLTSVTIGNSVESIGDNAFYGCRSLTSVDIGNSVTIIGERAFYACSDLDTISIDATTPPSLGSYAFSSAPICYIPCGTKVDYANSSWSDYVDTFEEHLINATSGRYGPNIKWKYNDSKLSLFGMGNISKLDCTPWELVIDSIKEIEIENGITNIPADAFSNYTKLNKITLPSSLEEIGTNAFANCRRLYEIYSYASIPPLAEVSSFTNYNATLYVPCEHKQYYQSDMVFRLFSKIDCISSEEVETDGVIVVPGANNVTITWLKEDSAETYSIVIKKDGEVVCTLTFNSAGQLINIAFAPGRNGNHPAQYAEQVANGKGYRFTVTGLEEDTHYTYNIDVKNTASQTINSHAGEFTTQSTTAVDNITTNNANIKKIMRNGQFIIIRNGVEYNAVGQEL